MVQVSSMRAWLSAFVLMASLALAFMDRQVINLLVAPIKADLGLSDTAFSLLQGLAFAALFVVAVIPAGWVSDHASRRNVVLCGIVGWSVATAGCGLATGFWGLFAARAALGLCEAVLSPNAVSMIADLFEPGPRAKAVSLFNVGSTIGIGASLVFGGAVIHLAAGRSDAEIHPWRLVFFALALLGIVLAAIVLGVREPARRGSAALRAGTFGEALRFLGAHWSVVVPYFVAMGCAGIGVFSILGWIPAFLGRTYGWSPATIGFVYGTIVLIFAVGGAIVSGFAASAFIARGYVDGTLRTIIIGVAGMALFGILATLLPGPALGVPAIALMMFFAAIPFGPALAALTQIALPQVRGQVLGVYQLMFSLLGFTLGPLLVALLTEHVYGTPSAVGRSIATVLATLEPIALILLLLAMPSFRRAAEALASAESR